MCFGSRLSLNGIFDGENNVCELYRLFTWALMVQVESQVCVRINSQPVQVISKQCRGERGKVGQKIFLCGAPPLRISALVARNDIRLNVEKIPINTLRY